MTKKCRTWCLASKLQNQVGVDVHLLVFFKTRTKVVIPMQASHIKFLGKFRYRFCILWKSNY